MMYYNINSPVTVMVEHNVLVFIENAMNILGYNIYII